MNKTGVTGWSKPTKTVLGLMWWDKKKHRQEQVTFRNWKDKGHFYFDKIWRHRLMSREEAYHWLAKMLGVSERKAHFSVMTEQQCKDAVFYSQQFLNDNRRLDLDFGVDPITPYYELEHEQTIC